MIEPFVTAIKANPLLTTGILATMGGMLWTYIRQFPTKVSKYFWSSFSSTVEIKDTHYDFHEIRLWVNTLKPIFVPRNYQVPRGYSIVPGPGTYWYQYSGHFLSISVSEEKDDKGIVRNIKLLFRVIGRNVEASKFIIKQAQEWVNTLQKMKNYLKIGVQNGNSCDVYYRAKRNPNTLFHPVYAKLKTDLVKFLGNRQWYTDRGIPYHRGYMLYGPPGTGKTSIIKTIAGELGLELYIVNRLYDLGKFVASRGEEPKIVVLEDIDRDFKENVNIDEKKQQSEESTATSGFKISELLNAIDGIVCNNACVFIFTANDPSILPEAMKRPGRVDKSFHVGFLEEPEIRAYIDLFLGKDVHPEVEQALFAQAGRITGAEIQLKLMQCLEAQ